MLVQLFAGSFLLIAALCKSIEAIFLEYLELKGAVWYQIYLFSSVFGYICLIMYWLTSYTIQFSRNKNKVENNNTYNITYSAFLFALFPSLSISNLQVWKWLAMRGIIGGLSWIFYVIALIFLKPGDFILLQTATITIGGIILGMMIFGEKFTIAMFFSLLLLIAGVILVCQPSFIFITDDSGNISGIGLFFAFLAGFSRVITGIAVKKLKQFDLNWLSIAIIGQTFSASLGIAITFVQIILYASDVTRENQFWWKYGSGEGYTQSETSIYTFILIINGVVTFVWIISYTLAYLFGDIGWLSIITNSDVVMTYLMQILFLNEDDDWFAYVGVVCVIVACCILLGEQYWKGKNDVNTTSSSQHNRMVRIGSHSDEMSSSLINIDNEKNEDNML